MPLSSMGLPLRWDFSCACTGLARGMRRKEGLARGLALKGDGRFMDLTYQILHMCLWTLRSHVLCLQVVQMSHLHLENSE